MKNLVLFLFLSCGLMFASAGVKPQYQSGTILSVHDYEAPSNTGFENPTDAPLQTQAYIYDIGIQLGCNVYGLRYPSAIDYLPSVFSPDHTVSVLPQKHFMYVTLPGGREVNLEIHSNRKLKNASCTNDN